LAIALGCLFANIGCHNTSYSGNYGDGNYGSGYGGSGYASVAVATVRLTVD
jgi:hypothetical protein